MDEKSFIWFEGDTMHLDADRYALLRGITLEEAETELYQLASKLMPTTLVSTEWAKRQEKRQRHSF